MKKLLIHLGSALVATSVLAASPVAYDPCYTTGVSMGQDGLGITYESPRYIGTASFKAASNSSAGSGGQSYEYNVASFSLSGGQKFALGQRSSQTVLLSGLLHATDNWTEFDEDGINSMPYQISIDTGFLHDLMRKGKSKLQLMARLPIIGYYNNGRKGGGEFNSAFLFGNPFSSSQYNFTTGLTYYFR